MDKTNAYALNVKDSRCPGSTMFIALNSHTKYDPRLFVTLKVLMFANLECFVHLPFFVYNKQSWQSTFLLIEELYVCL
jgi:hypothetical protein